MAGNGGIIGPVNTVVPTNCVAAAKITTVTATGCFTTQPGTQFVQTLVVGGGGGGGGDQGGGGGGGGYVADPSTAVSGNTAYPIVIGGGGAGGPFPGANLGTTGVDTTGFCLTAKGGGGGGSGNPTGIALDGGSGGGGRANRSPGAAGSEIQTPQPGDSGTYGFGSAGGPNPGATGSPSGTSAGGGGAGGVGGAATVPSAPGGATGGVGKTSNISGSCLAYAGGGGGGGPSPTTGGASPCCTGGASGGYPGGTAVAGTTNRGGGGGAGAGAGAAGGPGVIVVNELAVASSASGVWQMNTVYCQVKNDKWIYNTADIEYLVVGGGGGSGGNYFHIQGGGGGGAGGYRASGYGPAPLQGCKISALKYGAYTVTVGGAGTKGFMASAGPTPGPGVASTPGGNSIFNPGGVEGTSMITATGGGGGAQPSVQGAPGSAAQPGGSGGGGGGSGGSAGTGNAGCYSPAEGNAGGAGGTGCMTGSGSGGGATGAGSSSPGPGVNPSVPSRGAGAPNAITESTVTYATGGSFTSRNPGGALVPACAGGANTGDGGDSQGVGPSPANPGIGANYDGLAGGSGVVILRVPGAVPVAVSPGCNSVATCVGPANDKVATFTVTGTLTL